MPMRAMSAVFLPVSASPSNSALPLVFTIPESARRTVVLPAPLGPRMATLPPFSTSKSMPSITSTSP